MRLVFPVLLTILGLSTATASPKRVGPVAQPPAKTLATQGFGLGQFSRAFTMNAGPLVIENFRGIWALSQSQGLDCAPALHVLVEDSGSLLKTVPSSGHPRPDFMIPQINGGDFKDFKLGEGWHWSRAVGEAGRIYQTATVSSLMLVHTRVERELELMSDASLVITASERHEHVTENYRCVYYRPAPIAQPFKF